MGRKHKKVCGVGINDASYRTCLHERVEGKNKTIWMCPFYRRWTNLLARCYSDKCLERQPTYKGCTVCEEWLIFSNFKRWMENHNWEGNQLDKDLLVKGNKEYGPTTCVFISKTVNSFIKDNSSIRGQYPIGCCFDKRSGKFRANCSNPFTGKVEWLGYFDCPDEAHLAWKRRKHELACQLADSEHVTDERVAQALRTRYL